MSVVEVRAGRHLKELHTPSPAEDGNSKSWTSLERYLTKLLLNIPILEVPKLPLSVCSSILLSLWLHRCLGFVCLFVCFPVLILWTKLTLLQFKSIAGYLLWREDKERIIFFSLHPAFTSISLWSSETSEFYFFLWTNNPYYLRFISYILFLKPWLLCCPFDSFSISWRVEPMQSSNCGLASKHQVEWKDCCPWGVKYSCSYVPAWCQPFLPADRLVNLGSTCDSF